MTSGEHGRGQFQNVKVTDYLITNQEIFTGED